MTRVIKPLYLLIKLDVDADVVYNVSINVNLDEHVQRLDNSGHYKYPAISQPGSS